MKYDKIINIEINNFFFFKNECEFYEILNEFF